MGHCNDFQHIFVNQKKSENDGPYFQTMLFLLTVIEFISSLLLLTMKSILFLKWNQESVFSRYILQLKLTVNLKYLHHLDFTVDGRALRKPYPW